MSNDAATLGRSALIVFNLVCISTNIYRYIKYRYYIYIDLLNIFRNIKQSKEKLTEQTMQ